MRKIHADGKKFTSRFRRISEGIIRDEYLRGLGSLFHHDLGGRGFLYGHLLAYQDLTKRAAAVPSRILLLSLMRISYPPWGLRGDPFLRVPGHGQPRLGTDYSI